MADGPYSLHHSHGGTQRWTRKQSSFIDRFVATFPNHLFFT